MRRRGVVSDEERRLWVSIARTVKPLRGKALPDLPPEPPAVGMAAALDSAPPPPVAASAPPGASLAKSAARRGGVAAAPPPLHPIERPVRRKIGRGRIPLDDRIDLHGLTEAVAHGTLLFFLRRAQSEGYRHVLVITGRGASFGSTGILKRAMPHWFSTGDFRHLVAGFEPAERGHGGEGAFYVRVRRRP